MLKFGAVWEMHLTNRNIVMESSSFIYTWKRDSYFLIFISSSSSSSYSSNSMSRLKKKNDLLYMREEKPFALLVYILYGPIVPHNVLFFSVLPYKTMHELIYTWALQLYWYNSYCPIGILDSLVFVCNWCGCEV